MEYNYKYISPERCKEVNNMKIPSPFPTYYPQFFVMKSEGEKHYSSVDEKCILTCAFIPIPADREFYEDHYLFIKENEYYIFTYKTISHRYERIDNAIYSYVVKEINPNTEIDSCSEKDVVLHIISKMMKKRDSELVENYSLKHLKHILHEKIVYNGKEII